VKIFDTKIEFYNPGRLPDTISVDDLLNNTYQSTPRNKLIADVFKDMGHIEKYGSGIQRIINHFKQEELPMPSFQNISEGFMVTITGSDDSLGKSLNKVAEKVAEKVVENLTHNQKKIVDLIANNKFATAIEISKEVGISHRKTQENIAKLKELGLLKRIGPAKGGHWQIL
jgi:ATP-dependent DNA helicase RecG